MEDCSEKYHGEEEVETGNVVLVGEDYYDSVAKTVATVIFPDHIDRKYMYDDASELKGRKEQKKTKPGLFWQF